MPSIRIGFSTDFNLTSEQVGIGTTLPTARLDVRGQIRSDNASGSGGISTFTEYQGFLHSKQGIGNTVSIAQTTKGNLNSLSGEIVISGEVTVSEGTPIGGGRLDSLTVTSSFDLPHGGSANREVAPEKGSTRFNQDLGQLEFYTGYEWRTVGSIDGTGRGRGVFGGGFSAGAENMEYINISSLGNSINFGTYNLTSGTNGTVGGVASETRGLWSGGTGSAPVSRLLLIEYTTIASQGNTITFGNLATNKYVHGACSSSTRGVYGGGQPGSTNVIEYSQISTLGNALDFGDLSGTKQSLSAASSPTRGLFLGGTFPGGGIIYYSAIEYIQISSTGNAVNFGNLTSAALGCSNSNGLRCVTRIQSDGAVRINSIEYVTISTTGNAVDFGDSTVLCSNSFTSGVSSKTRGVFAGGNDGTNNLNTIEYITFSTTGNALDFGDLSKPMGNVSGLSDSHGGLGGF